PDVAHLNALNETRVGGLFRGGAAVTVPSADGKSVVRLGLPLTIYRGQTQTNAFYVTQLNPGFKIKKGKSAEKTMQRLNSDLTSGKIKQTFVGLERAY